MRKFSILLVFVYVTIFSLYNFVIAANPASPIVPGDNIQDPGDPLTAWGGCGPSESNCYVTVSSEISGLDAASATNTINNAAYLQEWQWNTLAGGSALKLSSTSTLATGDTQKLFEVALSGANDVATETTYAGHFSNTHTGATSTNVGLYATASGGTTNYAIESDGALLLDNVLFTNIGTRSISIGAGTPAVTDSFFFGTNAGLTATGANNSIFIGPEAGELATNALNSVFLGFQSGEIASAADYSVFIGDQSGEDATNANEAVYIGRRAGQLAVSAENSVFLGEDAGWSADNASESIFIGTAAGSNDAVTNDNTKYSILLGPGTSTGGFSSSIAMGRGATNTASNQLVIGSSTGGTINSISSVFFGSGVTATAPVDYIINGSGASGTDIGGGDVTIAGGKATGNASGGSILFQTSDAGASGVTLQSLTTKMTLLPSGFFGIGDTTPDYLLDIESLSTDTYMYSLHDSDGECLHDPEAGAETVTCSSDERLKTNIVDSDSVLEYLNGFRIRSYDVLASGDHMTGVIAQEVMQDYPELVSTLPSGMYSVQLPNQWKLVKGIQELDLKLKDISDFENENDNSFVAKLRNWFGNSANGIKKLFVKEEICIGETCINEEQLKALILNNQSNNVIENNEENIPIPEEESDENIDENPAVEEGTEDVIIEELEEVVTEGDVEENTETVVEPEIIN